MFLESFKFSRIIEAILLLVLLTSCAVVPVLPPVTQLPRQLPELPMVIEARPVIAFVLGSGAARGFAHVGVLNALEEHGIVADIVVGTSAGSVVGSLYSGGIRGQTLVSAAHQLNIKKLTDWMVPNRGVVRGELLQRYVNDLLQDRPIEALPTKFIAVATDLLNGELVAFNYGDTGMAVRASSAIPGLIQPVMINGREYVDGGLVSQVSVRVARQLGADVIIAVDVSKNPFKPDQLNSTFAVMQQAIIIMSHKLAEAEVGEADILIRPEVGGIAVAEFELRNQAVAAGEAATLAVMDEIKAAIAAKAKSKIQ